MLLLSDSDAGSRGASLGEDFVEDRGLKVALAGGEGRVGGGMAGGVGGTGWAPPFISFVVCVFRSLKYTLIS